MILQSLITAKLASREINTVVKALGYNIKSCEKVSARINAIINSPHLALDESSFDFHYSTPELIKKLCAVLDIPALLCNKIISETNDYLLQQTQKFKPYIFIETNFHRKSEPIFALALLESTRHISLEPDLLNLSLNDLLDHVQELVKSHYQNQSAPLIWGKIEQYALFYDENTVIVLSATGEIINAETYYSRSKATLNL